MRLLCPNFLPRQALEGLLGVSLFGSLRPPLMLAVHAALSAGQQALAAGVVLAAVTAWLGVLLAALVVRKGVREQIPRWAYGAWGGLAVLAVVGLCEGMYTKAMFVSYSNPNALLIVPCCGFLFSAAFILRWRRPEASGRRLEDPR